MYEELNTHTGQRVFFSRESLQSRLQAIGIGDAVKVIDEIDAGAEVETDHQSFRRVAA